MLDKLYAAWRARRVLLVSGQDRQSQWMLSFLEELGAKAARIPPDASAEMLCRAMSEGRISAVIAPKADALSAEGSLIAQLTALSTLLNEAREAGVPLVMLCSSANVYRAQQHPWYAREDDPIGGETRDGLIQSILQTFADGVSRALMGDAVSVQCIRHMPCLGEGNPSVAQYGAWCDALLDGELVSVEHPSMQGVFLHPLDVICGALSLGARYFAGEEPCTGIFNLGAGPHNLSANRSAALRLISRSGGTRPICESNPPVDVVPPLLDGSRSRLLCGIRSLISGEEALSMLLELTRAARESKEAEMDEIRAQTQRYISLMS